MRRCGATAHENSQPQPPPAPIGAQSSSSARHGRIATARSWSSALLAEGPRAGVFSNFIFGVGGSDFCAAKKSLLRSAATRSMLSENLQDLEAKRGHEP